MGSRLAEELAGEEGTEVWGLRRNVDALPAGVRPVAADLLDPELAALLPPATEVVYAASADASSEEAYRRIYVDGTRNLLRALGEGRGAVERFVFVSSTGVYGDVDGAEVDEESPTKPSGFRGRILLEGERTVLEGLPGSVVLRLGGIYGPGRTRLLDRIRSGEARCPPEDPVWSNRIHRDDAARALAHLLTVESRGHRVYLGVDEQPTPLCQIYRDLARRLGVPLPTRSRSVTRRRSNKRCSSRRLRESGFRFVFPSYREGYGDLIEQGA